MDFVTVRSVSWSRAASPLERVVFRSASGWGSSSVLDFSSVLGSRFVFAMLFDSRRRSVMASALPAAWARSWWSVP